MRVTAITATHQSSNTIRDRVWRIELRIAVVQAARLRAPAKLTVNTLCILQLASVNSKLVFPSRRNSLLSEWRAVSRNERQCGYPCIAHACRNQWRSHYHFNSFLVEFVVKLFIKPSILPLWGAAVLKQHLLAAQCKHTFRWFFTTSECSVFTMASVAAGSSIHFK